MNSKINKLKELESKILKERKLVLLHEEKLKLLEEKYKRESVSELPILLFSVDTTLPMPDDDEDYEYRYLYYYPDLNDIKIIIGDYKKKLLPNTLDLRDKFDNMGIPKRFWPGDPFIEYYQIVDKTVQFLKNVIEKIYLNNSINSLNELKEFMLNNNSIVEHLDNNIMKIKN